MKKRFDEQISSYSDEQIRHCAREKIARLFGVEIDVLSDKAIFGEDLKARFVSDFRMNEFDQLNDDIRDVADRQILKELDSGSLVIRTVFDYCNHMIRCVRLKPEEVGRVLQQSPR